MPRERALLSLRQRVGYGVGDLGYTLFFQMALLYLIFFYTDVAGIAPAATATILLVARTIDAVTNPVIGALADRTRTRWGRFRPFLLLGAIPLALTAFATFTTVEGSATTKLAYAIASYTAFSICFALVAVPYSALLACITSDPRERTTLGTLRAGFSFSAGIVVSLITLPLVQAFGGGQRGFHVAVALFGIVGVALVWTAFANTREIERTGEDVTPSLLVSLRSLRSVPYILFVAIFLLNNIGVMMRSAGAIYYFKYELGREELVSTYLTFGAVMTVVGIITTPFLDRLVGKRVVMIVGLAMMTVSYIMMSILPAGIVTTFVWLGFFAFFGFGLKAATTWPILAECVDHIEWRSGNRVEGLAYGFATFAHKLSLALGGAIVGWTLSATGYVANQTQTAQALRGISAMVGIIPALCLVLALVCGILFPLTPKRVDEITRALTARRNRPDGPARDPI